MARILLISLSDTSRSLRARRQIEALRDAHEVIVAGLESPREDVPFVRLPLLFPSVPIAAATRVAERVLLAIGRPLAAYYLTRHRRIWRDLLLGIRPDLVLVGHVQALPVALAAASGAPVIFDGQEHEPSEYEALRRWRWLHRPMVRALWFGYLPKTAALIALGPGTAALFEAETGVASTIVTNAAPYASLAPSRVDPKNIRLVYWGIAAPQRHLEDTIDLMKHLGAEYSLDLVLMNNDDYVDRLKRRASGDSRIRFLPPVTAEAIPRMGNGYDIGVMLFRDDDLQHRLALPNKFFESVQARLAVLTGPSPDMVALAQDWGFGILSKDFTPESAARAVASLTVEDLEKRKANADRAAQELSAENNVEVIRTLIARVLSEAEQSPSANCSALERLDSTKR